MSTTESAPPAGDELVRVCTLDELPQGGAARAEIDGTAVAVVRTQDGEVHAVADACSHGAVSLSEGEVSGCLIECWLHGSAFDLRTGRPTGLPATQPIAVHRVEVRGEDVYVSPAGSIPAQ